MEPKFKELSPTDLSVGGFRTVTLTLPDYVVDYLQDIALNGRADTSLYAILGGTSLMKQASDHRDGIPLEDFHHGL